MKSATTGPGVQNGHPITQGSTDRFNLNVAVGHTAVLRQDWFLDVKASYLRFNDDLFPNTPFDTASLGYSPSTQALLGGYEHIPRFNLESGSGTAAGAVAILGGQQNGFNTGRAQPFYNLQFAPTITRSFGGHTVKVGYDLRSLRQTEVNQGWRGGAYGFDSAYTRASATAPGQFGQGIASFVLGLPTNNSFIELRPDYDYSVVSHGIFVHDDWRVSSKLTLNVGVRYDLELGMTEAGNRNTRGFDFTTASPIQAAAAARFAASRPAGVPLTPEQFAASLVGGYSYLSDAENRVWDADRNNIQPRIGATYKVGERAVIRGGFGVYSAPFQIQGVPGLNNVLNQIGYSRSTPVPVTNDGGLTFNANLSNPVPSNTLLEPVGSSLGLATNLGGSPGTVFAAERKNPTFWRYSLGIERELPGNMIVEVSYLGQTGRDLPIVEPLNYVPEAFRTQSVVRDTAAETFLTQTVSNPFQGLFPDNPGVSGSTIARRRLLLAYPQFDTLSIETERGSNTYHGVLARLDKRFTNGVMIMSTYTWSRFREKVAPLNPWEDLEDRIGPGDRPHRVTLASVVELPFGQGPAIGREWGGATNALLGGWQLSGKFEWQTGQPLTWGNVYYDAGCGSPNDLAGRWGTENGQKLGIDVPFFDTSCFYTRDGQPFRNAAGQPVTFGAPEISLGAANIRRFPTTLANVRFQNHHLLDLGLTKAFASRQPRPRAGADRGAERDQLHAVQRRQRDPRADQRGVRQDHQHRLEHRDEAARLPAGGPGHLLTLAGLPGASEGGREGGLSPGQTAARHGPRVVRRPGSSAPLRTRAPGVFRPLGPDSPSAGKPCYRREFATGRAAPEGCPEPPGASRNLRRGQSRIRRKGVPPEPGQPRPQPPVPLAPALGPEERPCRSRQRQGRRSEGVARRHRVAHRQDGRQGHHPQERRRPLQVAADGQAQRLAHAGLGTGARPPDKHSSTISRSSRMRGSPPDDFIARSVRNTASTAARIRSGGAICGSLFRTHQPIWPSVM